MLHAVHVEWNVKEYAAASPASRIRKFPHPALGRYSKPATLVDMEGTIIMWYLPRLLPDKLHIRILLPLFSFNLMVECRPTPLPPQEGSVV